MLQTAPGIIHRGLAATKLISSASCTSRAACSLDGFSSGVRQKQHAHALHRRAASGLRAMTAAAGNSVGPDGDNAHVRLRVYKAGANGSLARITLCREKVLNALDAAAVEAVRRHLLDCAAGPHAGADAILLDSSTPRAFCAGGDVKSARAAVLSAPYSGAPPAGHHIHRVFQAEYSTVILASELSARLPLIALCDGIWMGLGFGLAGYCRHRIITENTVFAMPENLIGLWPDVGFAYRAARLSSPAIGLYLALTGARTASPSDLLWLGIATHFVPASDAARLREALEADPRASEATIAARCTSDPRDLPGGSSDGPLRRAAAVLERFFGPLLTEFGGSGGGGGGGSSGGCFAAEAQALQRLVAMLEKELAALEASSSSSGDAATTANLLRGALESLRTTSPGSQIITLRHFAAAHAAAAAGTAAAAAAGGGSGSSAGGLGMLRGLMGVEYNMAVRRVAQPDFLEGVRALLVDKDRSPAWRSPALSALTGAAAVGGGGGGSDSGKEAGGEAGEEDALIAGLAAPLPAACGVVGLDLREVDEALAAFDAAVAKAKGAAVASNRA